MTTSHSPLSKLKAQADGIAMLLKQVERGELIKTAFAQKLYDARKGDKVKFAVVMDDKILSIEMTWDIISKTSEVGIAEYILRYMRGSRDIMQ